MLSLTYHLTTEQAPDGSEQHYSRLLLLGASKAEVEQFMGLEGVRDRFEMRTLAGEELEAMEEKGQAAVSILVNKKLYEGRATHPGYTLVETLNMLFATAERHKKKLQIAPSFLAQLQEGFEIKKAQAAQILPIYGYEDEVVNLSLPAFSALIKRLNDHWKNEDSLECLDKFGEFEDAEQVEELVKARNIQGQILAHHSATVSVGKNESTKEARAILPAPLAATTEKAENKEENNKPSELAKKLARIFFLTAYRGFYVVSEDQINKMAALFSEFATEELVAEIEKNDKLASAIHQPQAKAEQEKRAHILAVLGAILRGSNTLFRKDRVALQKIAKAALELLLFTPQQIKKIDPQLIDQPSTLNKEKVIKLTEVILLEAGLIGQQLKKKILKPLEDEHKRLVDKQKAAVAKDKGGYEERITAFKATIENTKTVLQEYERNKNQGVCKAGLSAALTALKQNPAIVKYQPYEQFLRKLLNAAVLIFTGVLPGLIKYAVTGSLFFSVEGQSKNTAEMVFEKTQRLKI